MILLTTEKTDTAGAVDRLVKLQHSRGRPASYQEILDGDSRPVPEYLRRTNPGSFTDDDLSIDVYIDRKYHELEKTHIWARTWQFVCREEQIPEVGDHIVYDITDQSYIVIRSDPQTIKAFPNACLHRGRQLKQYAGRCSEIRCPFHGFAWRLDGSLQDIPMSWEFPHVDPERFHLPEVAVDTWQGFVFINPDPAAPPLRDFLGEVENDFRTWYGHERYLQAHVSKPLRCNWKIASEAFMECWHLQATHPQAVGYVGVPLCQVDVDENFARFITPSEVLGPFSDDKTPEEMLRATVDVRDDEEVTFDLLPGESARDYVARTTRDKWRGLIGDAVDTWSDADLVDNFNYIVFPNFWPWGGVHKLVYRFRPNGDDHRTCLMEIMMVTPFQGERPPPAEETKLGLDDPWVDAPELGLLGPLLDQDAFNVERVQRGLETTVKPGVTLATHEENVLKWFRRRYDRALGVGE